MRESNLRVMFKNLAANQPRQNFKKGGFLGAITDAARWVGDKIEFVFEKVGDAIEWAGDLVGLEKEDIPDLIAAFKSTYNPSEGEVDQFYAKLLAATQGTSLGKELSGKIDIDKIPMGDTGFVSNIKGVKATDSVPKQTDPLALAKVSGNNAYDFGKIANATKTITNLNELTVDPKGPRGTTINIPQISIG